MYGTQTACARRGHPAPCSRLERDPNRRLTTRQTQALPARGPGGADIKFAACPANEVVVGFSGYVLFFVDALTFKCAPLTVMSSSTEHVLTIGQTTDTATLGSEEFGTPFAAVDCLPDQVAVSQLVNAGDEIDSFGLACSKVTLVVE